MSWPIIWLRSIIRSIAFIRKSPFILFLNGWNLIGNSEMLVANYFPKMMTKASGYLAAANFQAQSQAQGGQQKSLLD